MSATALLHNVGNHSGNIKQPFYVGIYHPLPIIHNTILHGIEPNCQTCIVHKNINILPLFRQIAQMFLNLLLGAYIKYQREYLYPIFIFYLKGKSLKPVCPAASNNEPVPLLCKKDCNSLPYSRCGTGYQSYLSHIIIMYKQRFQPDS